MKCPVCKTEVEKLARGGLCPNFECMIPLKIIEKDGVRELSFRKKREIFKEDDIEVYNTISNESGVKVQKSNKGNYIITFNRQLNFNWIYCPGCESKMFQNNMIKGSMEHKCHKCKTTTTYIFS